MIICNIVTDRPITTRRLKIRREATLEKSYISNLPHTKGNIEYNCCVISYVEMFKDLQILVLTWQENFSCRIPKNAEDRLLWRIIYIYIRTSCVRACMSVCACVGVCVRVKIVDLFYPSNKFSLLLRHFSRRETSPICCVLIPSHEPTPHHIT